MKLVLGGDLQSVYSEIYRLVSRLHFTPEYVEALAPAERYVYLAEYEQEQKDREKAQNGQENEEHSNILGDPLDYT